VGELETGMTVRELYDWQRFHVEHPLPVEVADIHGAMLMALMANIHRAKDSPVVNAPDFLIMKPRGEQAASPKPKLTMAQRMKAVTKA